MANASLGNGQKSIDAVLKGLHGIMGFCGAGGTGKTTVANLLHKEKQIPLVPSSTRGVFKMLGLESEAEQERLDGEGRKHLQKSIQDAYYRNLQGFPKGVSDRSPIDHWCYMLYYCGDYMSEAEVAWYRDRTAEGLKRFQYIVYFPLVTYPTHEDGMRKSGYGYRVAYDYLVQAALRDFGVAHYTIRLNTTPEERVSQLWNLLALRAATGP